jgi:hypothetical protein
MTAAPRPSPSFSARQRWAIRFQVALGLVSLGALLLMVNYLGLHYFRRWDLSSDPANRLSPQTLAILRGLTNEVSATIFFDPSRSLDLFSLTTRLLSEYKGVNPRLFTARTLNYALFDGEAREFLVKHHLNALSEKDFVYFESGGKSRVVYASELADFNFNEVLRGESREFRRSAFKGEMLFSSALFSLSYPRLKAFFLQGHGEHNPREARAETGYAKFAGLLTNECNVEAAPLLLRAAEIPSDCQLLVVAGPQSAAFTASELQKIQDYLVQGGRLLVLLPNRTMEESGGLEKLLAGWGVGVAAVDFKDPDSSASGHEQDLLVAFFNDGRSPLHPVVAQLVANELAIKLFASREVYALKADSKGADAPKVEGIAFSGTNSVDARGERGPRPLAVTVEQGNIKGVTLGRGDTRMVVIGDSLCFDNLNYSAAGNTYFARSAVNWLMDRPLPLLAGLGPRPLKEYKLMVTAAQFRRVCWLLLAGLPGSVLAAGALVWLSRRH